MASARFCQLRLSRSPNETDLKDVTHIHLTNKSTRENAGCISIIGGESRTKFDTDIVVLYLPFNLETVGMAHKFACVTKESLGCPVVVYQRRGVHCPLSSKAFFVLGNDDDVELAVKEVVRLFPRKKVLLMGQSAGATAIVRVLGQCSRFPFIHRHVVGAVGIAGALHSNMYSSMPWQIESAFISPVKEFINKAPVSSLNYSARSTERITKASQTMLEATKTQDMAKLEFCVMKELYGWSVEECNRRFLPEFHAPNISKPLLYICAEDDPICHSAHKFAYLVERNPNVLLVLTKNGAHCDFASRDPGGLSSVTWAEKMALMFINTF